MVGFPWADDEALIQMAVDNVLRAINAGCGDIHSVPGRASGRGTNDHDAGERS